MPHSTNYKLHSYNQGAYHGKALTKRFDNFTTRTQAKLCLSTPLQSPSPGTNPRAVILQVSILSCIGAHNNTPEQQVSLPRMNHDPPPCRGLEL